LVMLLVVTSVSMVNYCVIDLDIARPFTGWTIFVASAISVTNATIVSIGFSSTGQVNFSLSTTMATDLFACTITTNTGFLRQQRLLFLMNV
jgi:hypothetical protein